MLEFKNVSVEFDGVYAIDNFSLKLNRGDKVALMGISGSGKTSLLRLAQSLVPLAKGEVVANAKSAIMFQEPRLLPWKNAIKNITAVLPKDKQGLADKYLLAVGLSESSAKLPHELSGGMAQRVAFARFLAYAEATNAELLLLDEPFSAQDTETSEKMLELLKEFSKEKTLLFVTHDEHEADFLGARKIFIQ